VRSHEINETIIYFLKRLMVYMKSELNSLQTYLGFQRKSKRIPKKQIAKAFRATKYYVIRKSNIGII